MTRARDYQSTVERAREQSERAARKMATLQTKADDHHREMLRALAAARIANEEADALRDRNLALEQSVWDLKADNKALRTQVDLRGEMLRKLHDEIDAWRQQSIRHRVGGWFRGLLAKGAEA